MADSFAQLLADVQAVLAAGPQDTTWAAYDDAEELIGDLRALEAPLASDLAEARLSLEVLFAPTGALQETAMASGWHDTYMALARRADALLAGAGPAPGAERAYVRRRPSRRALVRQHARYELFRHAGPPVEVWLWGLDRLLHARRHPADFWAVVNEADRAFGEADPSWIEFPTGRRVPAPGLT